MDLERTVAAAVGCAIVAIFVPWEVVRLVAALPLAFFLPGYAITAAAFGRRRLDFPQLMMLSLSLSLMLLALGGLLLNYVGGLRTATWGALIVIVVVVGCRAAALRRGGERWRWPKARPGLRRADLLYGAAALAVAIAALALAYTPLQAGDATGYTALWILPARGSRPAVRVGAMSSEQTRVAFRLEVRADGHPPALRRFELVPGEERVFRIPLERRAVQGRTRVLATLFREASPHTLYRRVTTWLAGERIGR